MAHEYKIVYTRYRDNHVDVHRTMVRLFDNPQSSVIPAMITKLTTGGRTAALNGNVIEVRESNGDMRGTIEIMSRTVIATNEDDFIAEFNNV